MPCPGNLGIANNYEGLQDHSSLDIHQPPWNALDEAVDRMRAFPPLAFLGILDCLLFYVLILLLNSLRLRSSFIICPL